MPIHLVCHCDRQVGNKGHHQCSQLHGFRERLLLTFSSLVGVCVMLIPLRLFVFFLFSFRFFNLFYIPATVSPPPLFPLPSTSPSTNTHPILLKGKTSCGESTKPDTWSWGRSKPLPPASRLGKASIPLQGRDSKKPPPAPGIDPGPTARSSQTNRITQVSSTCRGPS